MAAPLGVGAPSATLSTSQCLALGCHEIVERDPPRQRVAVHRFAHEVPHARSSTVCGLDS
ncbi:hypothetical protein Micbo1qcDRAFT_163698 [Microdochium bolleyi]|uniref:Uncharacterized protein n=1 Tax=Microdochium bolleyi TaxID=196109 RepID=A0A136J1G6_9PEZI|nr:hypothetical protein Micbo1qcDRAFT_163698 [Microdochium bolleyi]